MKYRDVMQQEIKRIIIKIDTVNAAFKDNPLELVELLKDLALNIECGYEVWTGNILDSNGNKCGTLRVKK